MREKIQALCRQLGLAGAEFVTVPDMPGTPYAVSIAVPLSNAIVDEIDGAPTHSYFHHYRTVNAYIDHCLLRIGLLLGQHGYRYIPIGASQSVNLPGSSYQGRYSHKKVACMAGAGYIGKSCLFIHHQYGPRVRLGTLFCDCPALDTPPRPTGESCSSCTVCQQACPALAILGKNWNEVRCREEMFDPAACSQHMKRAYQHIGRGAVCGICMRVCPKGGHH
ncbi:4Fe-4S double cluster binding domain-containing protein [Neobittarella massiliensis]|uniref:4Fe-4S double cluster binding domain-containing protein n=1 Tax=Neobittarella massiliensis (ex Bilen et al. 2018) TaxID=2041842 RepID=UPI000CF68296|nr:4Fe-4S double cluster binding domain-containing protein [Neobittarella massiliensis]